MVSTDVKLRFLSSLEHFWPDPLNTLSKGAFFFEKMHKVREWIRLAMLAKLDFQEPKIFQLHFFSTHCPQFTEENENH